jgi:hypothetical protein
MNDECKHVWQYQGYDRETEDDIYVCACGAMQRRPRRTGAWFSFLKNSEVKEDG